MSNEKRTGPVEAQLRASEREALRGLCGLSNTQLLDLMEQQIEGPDGSFDEALFDAAQALLDERAPVQEEPWGEMTVQELVRRHPEVFGHDPGTDHRVTLQAYARRSDGGFDTGLITSRTVTCR